MLAAGIVVDAVVVIVVVVVVVEVDITASLRGRDAPGATKEADGDDGCR